MWVPSTKLELNSFLGKVNYLNHFIPTISNLTSNLRKLLKKDVLFQWTDSHDDFLELNNISCDVCLQYFNPS